MDIYIVTLIGVLTDTRVWAFKSYDDAKRQMELLISYQSGYDIRQYDEMCTDCIKGYSCGAECDVEIQIHKTKLT